MIFETALEFVSTFSNINQIRILGIDFGTKKTGIAISNENNKVALSWCVLNESSVQPLTLKIRELAQEKQCEFIVLGFPFGWEESAISKNIIKFARALSKEGFKVLLYDENNTSVKVRNVAFEARGKMTKKELQNYDKSVAALILQTALDEINSILSDK
jgi:putative Holliday junction resolvase